MSTSLGEPRVIHLVADDMVMAALTCMVQRIVPAKHVADLPKEALGLLGSEPCFDAPHQDKKSLNFTQLL